MKSTLKWPKAMTKRPQKIDDDKLIYAIGRIRLEPGDILVAKSNLLLTKEQAMAVRDQVKRFVPNNEVMVLVGHVDLAIIKVVESND